MTVRSLFRSLLSFVLIPPSLCLGGPTQNYCSKKAQQMEPPASSLCGQKSEQSRQLSFRFPEVSVFHPLQKQDVMLQSLTDDIGLPQSSCANSVSQILNVPDVETHGADLGNPLHGPSILTADPSGLDKGQHSKVHSTYNSNTNDIQGIAENPDSGTAELSADVNHDFGIQSTHPPSPDSSPLGWLLGRTREPGLREIQRARREQSTEFIVERVLARLVEIEARERKECNPSLTIDVRVAWRTCQLASQGHKEPFRQATRDILHCEPELVWQNIVTSRKLKLGKDYFLWYDSTDNPRPDLRYSTEVHTDSTSAQPLEPTGAGVTERVSPAPVPSKQKERTA